MPTKKAIVQYLNTLDLEDIYRIASEIDSYDGRFLIGDAGCPPMPTEELLFYIEQSEMSIRDVINMVRHGDAPDDEWLGLDGYGNFQSYTYADARACYLNYADEMQSGILDGLSDYASERIKDLDDGDDDEEEN